MWAELNTPDRLREALDVVEIVLGFLSSGGGKADKPLGDYIDKTLKMKKRHFSKKVGAPYIKLLELIIKGAISRKRQVFEKIAQKSILTFHWLKIGHWNAVCTCAFSYSRVDFNVRVYV